MAKKDTKTSIEFDWNGTHFKLEYTASSLKKLEKQGFSLGEIDKHLLSAPEELFNGAFIANHNNVPKSTREKIYKELTGENEAGETISEVLFAMVSEAVDEIGSHQGNIVWSVNR